MNAANAAAARTEEGLAIIDSEYRNDDPHVFDDCWHRGPYWVYSVRGTDVREETRPGDGVGDVWRRLEDSMRAAGLAGHAELLGDASKGLGYRRIVTIMSDAELAELRRKADEWAAKYADEPGDYFRD